jgi:hypothetical protein
MFTARLSFSPEDADEALSVALAHPENALTFYRGELARLRDPDVEARRAYVLETLIREPWKRIAVLIKSDSATITVAVRGVGSGEIDVPREKFDRWSLQSLIEQHFATVQ